jgi:preprotein translocase subunit SecY
MITLVGGTLFLIWLGEQTAARGASNGASLIIMTRIVANLPRVLVNLLGHESGAKPKLHDWVSGE